MDVPDSGIWSTFLAHLMCGNSPKTTSAIADDAVRGAGKGDVEALISVLNGYYRAFHSTELKQLNELGIQVIFKALFVIAGSKIMTGIPSGLEGMTPCS